MYIENFLPKRNDGLHPRAVKVSVAKNQRSIRPKCKIIFDAMFGPVVIVVSGV